MGWTHYLHFDKLYGALVKEGFIGPDDIVTRIVIEARVGEPCTLTVDSVMKYPTEIPASLKRASTEDEAIAK